MKFTLKQFLTAFAILLFFNQTSKAQLIVDTTLTATQLAQTLVGNGIQISNVTMNCPNGAHGGFTATGTNLGMSAGIILSSGMAKSAVGPNALMNTSTSFNAPGDPDLDTILAASSTNSNDACVLEFDVYVKYDTLVFDYVFGSEEYEEFVNSFNDVFALFVSGPGIVGKKNIAIIPGTTSPVSINNVNCAVNSTYYTCNDANSIGTNTCTAAQCPASNTTTTIEYDGITHVLQAKTPVIRCNTYHIKLAVADALDWVYDSGIFIEAGSLSSIGFSATASTVGAGSYPNAVEGCLNGQFQFHRKTLVNQHEVFHYQILGTATNGVDYNHIADSVVFNIGDTLKTLNIIPIQDNIAEPNETIELILTDSACSYAWSDTVTITIQDPLQVNAGRDTVVCTAPYHLNAVASGYIPSGTNYQYSWTPAANIISGANTASPICTLPQVHNTFYVSVINIPGCIVTDSVEVSLVQAANITTANDTTVCPNSPVSIWTKGGVNYQWTSLHHNTINCATCDSTTATIGNSTDSFFVKITGGGTGCTLYDTIAVHLLPNPTGNFSVVPNTICNGDSVQITYTGFINSPYAFPAVYHWNFGGGSGRQINSNQDYIQTWQNFSHSVDSIKHITLYVSQGNCVGNVFQQNVTIHPTPKAVITLPDSICSNTVFAVSGLTSLFNHAAGNAHYSWNWSGANNIHFNVDSSKDSIKVINPNLHFQPQKIYLNVTQFGCTSPLDSATCIIKPLPISSFAVMPDTICPNGITSIQYNGSSNANGSAITFVWNFDGGAANPGWGSALQKVVYANSSNAPIIKHPVLITKQDGCSSLPFIHPVVIINNPDAQIIGDDFICQGESTVFKALPTGMSYIWNTNATTDSIKVSQANYYLVTVSNAYGCWDTAMIYLVVNAKPFAKADSSQTIYLGSSVGLSGINSYGGNTYWWNPSSLLNNNTIASPVTAPTTNTTYQLIYSNSISGCSDTAYVTIDVNPCSPLRIPNAFSPNGDGIDDNFMVMNPDDAFEILSLDIYDRWGNLVFATNDKSSKGWDGNFQSKPMPAGVYIYKLTSRCGAANSKVMQKGDLTLIR